MNNPLITKELRKFYFRNGWTHNEVLSYLNNHFGINVHIRTLKRWKKELSNPDWVCPCKPNPPVPKSALSEIEKNRILAFRERTGFGPAIIKNVFNFTSSDSTIKRFIKYEGLSRGSKIENYRIHWVKWQRDNPDSLWQIDGSRKSDGYWILPVIDDCSRYFLGYRKLKSIKTKDVIEFLEELIKIYGKPREILTDNGSEFGGLCRTSMFDNWCTKQEIKHIRSKPHKPTTAGKMERFHSTFNNEIEYCDGDIDLFRYRYNQMRPHRSLHMKTPSEIYFSISIRIKGVGFNKSKW